jgi:TRAP-type C4-dicarboxylate transport system permease small subunit
MKRTYETICKGEIFLAAFCFSASCLVIFVAAVARSLHAPMNWSLDISLFLFAWSVFLSADVAMRSDKLVNVDIVTNLFPERCRKIVSVANHALILAFLIALLGYGLKLSYVTRARAFQGIPQMSYTWVTLSVPVGAMLQIVTVVIKLKGCLENCGVKLSRKGSAPR